MSDKTNHCTGCKERQDRIDELEAENTDLRRQMEASHNAEVITGLHDQLAAMKAAGDGLAGFAGHDDSCDTVMTPWTDPGPVCDCGYTKAWKAWSAANGH